VKPVIVEHPLGDDPPSARLYYGQNVLQTLADLPDASVQMAATSPPYWGLRDYGGEPAVWGGDPSHDHEWQEHRQYKDSPVRSGSEKTGFHDAETTKTQRWTTSGFCACGAWRGHLGLEPTPQMFVDNLVLIFREVRRVLRDDGALFLNLGDSYFGSSTSASKHKNLGRDMVEDGRWPKDKSAGGSNPNHKNTAWPAAKANPEAYWHLKPKDLVGIPWMVAFALRADGWYLRSDIVWAKPSCMPSSVRDRPTKNHEYIFLLTKNARYFYDQDAIREPLAGEPHAPGNKERDGVLMQERWNQGISTDPSADPDRVWGNPQGRNKRSVWSINPKPYRGAHFATWPEELVEVMVKAGSAEGHTVLDPFSGSATTGAVALRLGRHYIGCDLQPDYLDLAEARLQGRKAPAKGDDEPDLIGDLFG